jgi:hypothetical protein
MIMGNQGISHIMCAVCLQKNRGGTKMKCPFRTCVTERENVDEKVVSIDFLPCYGSDCMAYKAFDGEIHCLKLRCKIEKGE